MNYVNITAKKFALLNEALTKGATFIDGHNGELRKLQGVVAYQAENGVIHFCPWISNALFCLNPLETKDGVLHMDSASVGGNIVTRSSPQQFKAEDFQDDIYGTVLAVYAVMEEEDGKASLISVWGS